MSKRRATFITKVQLLDQIEIAPELTPKFKFTTQQYHLMHEVGVFSDGDRLELINGEIKPMSPISWKYGACVTGLQEL